MNARAEEARTRPRPTLLLAVALAVVALSYASALQGEFVWDDHPLIDEQPAVVEPLPLHRYFTRMFWSSPEYPMSRAFYRPLVVLSYRAEYALWGPEPLPFHVTNLAVHLLACALVFGLARRGGAPAEAAAAAALLFGTFPRLTESVAWISGRTDLLAGVGALAAWQLHDVAPARTRRRVAAAALLLLALLCKEVAIAGLCAIAAMELCAWRREGDLRRRLAHLAPYAVAVTIYAGLRVLAFASSPGDVPKGDSFPLAWRPAMALDALGRYAAMFLDPLRPRLQIGVAGATDAPFVALGVLAAAGLLALGLQLLRRRSTPPEMLAAYVLGGLAIAPVLHLITLPVNVVAADRFLYVPAAGLAIGLAIASRRLRPSAGRAALAACVAAGVAFGVATAARVPVWHDDLTLWRTAASRAHPWNALPHAGLGGTLLEDDRHAEALDALQEAMRREQAYRENVRSGPESESTLGNAALALARMGRVDEAVPILRYLARRNPKAPLNRYNLAMVEAQLLQFDAAEHHLQAALALYPGYPRATRYLADLRKARAAWEALPEPRIDESVSLSAERAAIFVLLGHVKAAESLWQRVAQSTESDPDDLRRATVFLVLEGEPALADAALARLKRVPEHRAEALRLEAALDARRAIERERRAS